MDQQELLAQLEGAGRDRELTARLVRELAAPGEVAAPGLVAALRTVNRSAMWGVRDALHLIGPAGLDAAVAARARAEKVPEGWELGHVLRGFDARSLGQYVTALTHPMTDIRRQALWGLQNLGEAAADAVPDVIPFLNSPESRMRRHAEETVRAIGGGSGDLLRRIRREGPGRLRRHALAALALTAGEAGLDERDRRALERLIRIKTAHDTPRNLPDHRWLAVPGEAYEGLFDAMGLHDRRPCTLSMGLSAMKDDVARVPGPDGEQRTAFRVFVTPELDGWRLVYADTPLWEQHWNVEGLLNRISAACGQAQFFFQDDHSDSMVWAVALDGAVRRRYWRYSTPEWVGEPLDWEQPLEPDPDGDPDDDPYDGEEPNASAETTVTAAAWGLSLDPTAVGGCTAMRGHGWLAITEPCVGHGPFTGALRI